MLGWLSVLKDALGVLRHVLDYIKERKLINQGRIDAYTKMMDKANEKLDKALAARRNVDTSASGVRNDPANRDNR